MSLLRRTFLKLTGGAATAIALTHQLVSYAEQEEIIPIDNSIKEDWIIDKGHYYIVTVPRKKLLKNESFDKPVLFILHEDAIVDSIFVNGFSTVVCDKGGAFSNSYIDCKNTLLKKPRAAVLIDKTSNRLLYTGNVIDGGPSTSYALEVAGNGNHHIENCHLNLAKDLDYCTTKLLDEHGYILPKSNNIAGVLISNYDKKPTMGNYLSETYSRA